MTDAVSYDVDTLLRVNTEGSRAVRILAEAVARSPLPQRVTKGSE